MLCPTFRHRFSPVAILAAIVLSLVFGSPVRAYADECEIGQSATVITPVEGAKDLWGIIPIHVALGPLPSPWEWTRVSIYFQPLNGGAYGSIFEADATLVNQQYAYYNYNPALANDGPVFSFRCAHTIGTASRPICNASCRSTATSPS